MSHLPRPTVYFIDDSATMREIVKAAFLRENISVVTCHDAGIALAEIELAPPDILITDIIMPGKDGYEVCRFIKQHPLLNKMPVILMSGLVDRTVAEKAFAVKADELIRKPFQPRDLVSRVRHFLNSEGPPPPADAQPPAAAPPPPAPDLPRPELHHLQALVKKLQAELEAEREYSRSLEAHFKTPKRGE